MKGVNSRPSVGPAPHFDISEGDKDTYSVQMALLRFVLAAESKFDCGWSVCM